MGMELLMVDLHLEHDVINEELGATCTECAANGGAWIPDPDDDPAYGNTNGDGMISWNISYSEALNAGDGNNPESYADFTSTVILNLIDPLQDSK